MSDVVSNAEFPTASAKRHDEHDDEVDGARRSDAQDVEWNRDDAAVLWIDHDDDREQQGVQRGGVMRGKSEFSRRASPFHGCNGKHGPMPVTEGMPRPTSTL